MDALDKSNQTKINHSFSEKNTPVFVFNIQESDIIKATPEEEGLLDKMKQVADLYKTERYNSTLDLEVTEEVFNKLKGRRGFAGEGYSRLVQILDEGKVGYHVIVSPFTNVSEIRHSNEPDREELVLVAKGLNMFQGHDIRFELAPVNSHEVADIEDRSEIYPQDLLKIELIPIETAKNLILQK